MENNFKQDQNKENLNYYFKKIENYFKVKDDYIVNLKHIPVNKIIEDAPKFYVLISIIEKINILISKNNEWLKDFVRFHNIKFDLAAYQRWKSGKKFQNFHYSDTQAPSKWIHILQDFFIDLLENIQILLMMEFYIDDKLYKDFVKNNREFYFKVIANYSKPSMPSEDIEKFFEIIDYLLAINIENNFPTNHVIDTTVCLQVYRTIDKSKIFDLLKRKEYYVKYHLEYLKKSSLNFRDKIPYEEDVVKVAENFIMNAFELRTTYNEYKNRLIEKKEKVIKKIQK